MKKIIFVLGILFVCLPVWAQTNLTRGLLSVHEDINNTPDLFVGNNTIYTIVINRFTRSIPEGAFSGTGVRNLTFEHPSFITVIPNGTFAYNLFLVNANLPDNLLVIGESAFGSCVSLRRITLPRSLREIQFAAFWNTGLTHLFIPDSVEIIGPSILYGTDSIQTLRLPANADIHESNSFHHAYVTNERRAGVYARMNGTWVFRRDMTEAEFQAMH